jgi:hypothetical protein
LTTPVDPTRSDEPARELVHLDIDTLRRSSKSRGVPASGRGSKG